MSTPIPALAAPSTRVTAQRSAVGDAAPPGRTSTPPPGQVNTNQIPHASLAELSDLLDEHRLIVQHVAPLLAQLAEHTKESHSVIMLASAQGTVLTRSGDLSFAIDGDKFALRPGANWLGQWRGDNAIDMAVATRRAASVYGPAHGLACHQGLSCAAAPISLPHSGLGGIINISAPLGEVNRHTLGLVQFAASQVEHRLFLAQNQGNSLLHVHKFREGIDTHTEALLAISEDGRVAGCNTAAQMIFGHGASGLVFRKLEDILIDTFIEPPDLPSLKEPTPCRTAKGTLHITLRPPALVQEHAASPATPSDSARASDRRARLRLDLPLAMGRNELSVEFQPQVRVRGGQGCAHGDIELFGVEALLRWHHPKYGAISPTEFIQIAEASGDIYAIGAWTLRKACRQLRIWRKHGLPEMRLSVNMSPVQLSKTGALDELIHILLESRLPPGSVDLELTESVFIQNTPETLEGLERLRKAGFGLAIDDFGTGYSSLAYLEHFPFTVLKTDMQFTRKLGESHKSQAILRSIIAVAQAIGLEVITEGVENEDQHRTIVALGGSIMQGYYHGRPMGASQLTAWLWDLAAKNETRATQMSISTESALSSISSRREAASPLPISLLNETSVSSKPGSP